LAATVVAHFIAYPRFVINSLPLFAGFAIGGSLVLLGVWLYVTALKALRVGFRRGTLVTEGLYSVVRHPIYSAWIFLIIPGFALTFRSWIVLITPVVAYVAMCITLPLEERELDERYGAEYKSYRRETGAVWPVFRRKGKGG